MWKVFTGVGLPLCRRAELFKLKGISFSKRQFLSEAFRCQDAWDRRLQSPILQNIKLEEFYLQLENKFNKDGKASAIDIDVFAAAMRDDSFMDELEDVVHKLRLTANTTDTLPSTHHSVIRTFLSSGKISDLLRILNDRLNYGIFPDDYCAVLLMDTFLKQKNYTEAAKVSVLQMLQEDFSHPLVAHLALYSCFMHLKSPGEWEDLTKAKAQEEDSGEEVKVRVKYLRNPYFDDHFDLTDPNHLVGKTLASLGAIFPDAVGKTYQLLGWAMYNKWDRVVSILQHILQDKQKPALFKEGIEILQPLTDVLEAPVKENVKKLLQQVESAGLITDDSLHDILMKKTQAAVEAHEKNAIEKQCQLYSEWDMLREDLLQEQVLKLRRLQRLAKVKEEKEKLEKREEIIFFFDNEEKLELEIEKKTRQKYRRLYKGKKKIKRVQDENYVPPEVK